MKAGKIAESVLKRSVLKPIQTGNKRNTNANSAVLSSAIGEDCAALRMQAEELVTLTCDPVIGTLDDLELLANRAVRKGVNNLSASGAKPVGLMLAVLLPTAANEPQLRKLMEAIQNACEKYGMQILGGHTEVARAVNAPVVVVTAVGAANKDEICSTQAVRPGMDIVVSKWVGLEGTVYLANQYEERLRTRYSQPFIDKAKAQAGFLTVESEAAVAISSGVSAMHDASEGGIFAALWEMAEGSGVGLEIDLKKIPIRQETVEICEFFGVNPYKLLSGGSLLMATEDGNGLVHELEKAGIPATIIGKATDKNDRILMNEDERRFLETPQSDEWYSVE